MAILMIGCALIASGIKYLGGGVFCAQNMLSRAAAFGSPQICSDSGQVKLAYGAAEHWGLAFAVILFGVFIQARGRPSNAGPSALRRRRAPDARA